MKFSIIIPVHNSKNFITKCVESIVNQPFGKEAQIILLENDSADNSLNICNILSKQYKNVEVFSYKNLGVYNIRRVGIKKAIGDYLLFLDSDDFLENDALSTLNHCIGEYNPDLIIFNAKTSISKKLFDFPFKEDLYTEKSLEIFYKTFCKSDMLNALWNKCVKKSIALKSIENNKDIFLNYNEDFLQSSFIINNASSIYYLDKSLYFYNNNDKSLTNSFNPNYLKNVFKAWNIFENASFPWTEKYISFLEERKALALFMYIEKLICSTFPYKEFKSEFNSLLNSKIFKEYKNISLPNFAPKNVVKVRNIINSKFFYQKILLEKILFLMKEKIKFAFYY